VLVVDFLEFRDVLLLTTLVGEAQSDLPASHSTIIPNHHQTAMHHRLLTTLHHLLMERHDQITVNTELLRQLRKLEHQQILKVNDIPR
jgi:hypothetical protein